MTLTRLHNEAWGFESNCFVCEPRNTAGLAIPFFHDDEADTVVAEFTLGTEFSGAPSYVHGGVTLAVLDEAQAWATIAVGGKFAVSLETTTRFKRPILVGEPYTVAARLTDKTADHLTTSAEVRNADGKRCAETTATFAVLSAATAVEALGAEASGSDADYLKD
ncbi:hypothetical protein BH24ACT3_BH24ACT3_19670 [soil metagenome]